MPQDAPQALDPYQDTPRPLALTGGQGARENPGTPETVW